MRTNGAIDQQLKQVCPQHVPVVVVLLLAVLAGNHEAAHPTVDKQCLVDGKVGKVLFDRVAFLGVQGLTGLQGVERR